MKEIELKKYLIDNYDSRGIEYGKGFKVGHLSLDEIELKNTLIGYSLAGKELTEIELFQNEAQRHSFSVFLDFEKIDPITEDMVSYKFKIYEPKEEYLKILNEYENLIKEYREKVSNSILNRQWINEIKKGV
jgi:hypothetical protein